jgi:hypothetical protein
MSNSKTAIQEIKSLMVKFGFLADESPLMSFKLEDDTILQTVKLEAGNKIVKINEAFEQVSLEDGSYRLKENFELEVKESEIVSVKEIFIDAKLVDGTVVKVEGDSVIEGAGVKVVTADAEIPAPDGVHELEDGSQIETKDGLIVKVVPAEVEVESPEESVGEPNEAPPAGGAKLPDTEIMDMLKEFIVKCSQKMADMELKLNSVEKQFNAFKKEPAGKKVADGKVDFNKNEDSNDDARLAAIMGLRKLNK